MRENISGIIPAVNDFAQLRAFLKSDYGRCVLMHWKLGDLDRVFPALKEKNRAALIHADLTAGLTADAAGAEYLVHKFSPEGIISTKSAAVTAAKELGVTSVQRVFLIDSAALARSEASVTRTAPDYVEFLPAPCPELFPMLSRKFGVPLIAGGLISSREMAEDLLSLGTVRAVTVSMATLGRNGENI